MPKKQQVGRIKIDTLSVIGYFKNKDHGQGYKVMDMDVICKGFH